MKKPTAAFNWARFAHRTEHMQRSAIREILKLTEKGDVISFAGGLPAKEIFPVAQILEICQTVFAQGPEALQYSTTEGYGPLREFLAETHRRRGDGDHITSEHVQILSGSQQGLDLLGKIYIDPGDPVVVEEPTYVGAMQAFSQYEATYLTVTTDAEGMVLDGLEALLAKHHPKLIYTVPTFHNPLGVSMSLRRRRRLVELSQRYHVPIIEDDPYRELRYVGEELPTLYQLSGGRGVIYLGTFSKTVAPGFRVGWMLGPSEVREKIVATKQAADLHTSSASQRFIYEYCRAGWLDRHLETIRDVYEARRMTMLLALKEHFPAEARWTVPDGGLFIWVTLPEGVSVQPILEDALARERVAFIPGTAFFVRGGGQNTLRLNFSHSRVEVIADGIARLGRVVHDWVGPGTGRGQRAASPETAGA